MMSLRAAVLLFFCMINMRNRRKAQILFRNGPITNGSQDKLHHAEQFIIIDSKLLGQDIPFPVAFRTAVAYKSVPSLDAHLSPFADAGHVVESHALIGTSMAA